MVSDRSKEVTRREFLELGAGAAAGAALLSPLGQLLAAGGQRKPNLLFVFADQMRNASLGCMGNAEIHTPNLDQLAKEGVLFRNAISTYPVCTPYRGMLLTGRYATTTGCVANGVELNSSEVTIAELLKSSAYRTGYIGKWHLEMNGQPFVPKERRQGFDFWRVRNTGGPHWDSFCYGDDPNTQIPLPGYVPDATTKIAVEYIEQHAKQPFCLFLSWGAPHPAYDPPEKYEKMYNPAKLTQRRNVKGDEYRANLAKYYGMITNLDDNMRKLMAALDKAGIAQDTIVCFTSDHGDMMGSHSRFGKNVPWEESINVPFILRYPRLLRPAKTDLLLSTVDIMPTLLSLCGAQVPKSVQGRDLSYFLLGKNGKPVRGWPNSWPHILRPGPPHAVLIERVIAGRDPQLGVDAWRGIRTARYTYVRAKEKPWLLYDNQQDPYQLRNLIGQPQMKDVQQALDAELQNLLKKAGDDFASVAEWRQRIKGHSNPRLTDEETRGGRRGGRRRAR